MCLLRRCGEVVQDDSVQFMWSAAGVVTGTNPKRTRRRAKRSDKVNVSINRTKQRGRTRTQNADKRNREGFVLSPRERGREREEGETATRGLKGQSTKRQGNA